MKRTLMITRSGNLELWLGYGLGILHLATKDNVLFILSACASIMACINYYFNIKKNRTK